tara:strand:+ start:283 stop:603 length:321 start_codon:yes stop_codon:yes gene_type:complete
MTIRKMVKPMDKANQIALKIIICINGKTAKHEPIKKPRKCPPIILFGSAEILFGKAKIMNAVAPILAITTGFSDKIRVIMNTDRAAYELCTIYAFHCGGKLESIFI